MHTFTVFVAALTMTAVVSIGFDAVAASKNDGGPQIMAESKKCKEGHVYSETEKKCIPKPGPARPDKS
jgi:hypothetical protein